MPRRRIAIALAVFALAGGVGLALQRVYTLERSEMAFESEPRTLAELRQSEGSTRLSARIAEVSLRRGEHVVFEICTADRLRARWRGQLDFALFQLEPMRLLLRVPLDQAHLDRAERGPQGACLLLGSGTIETSGKHSIDAIWPERPPDPAIQQVPLRGRVLARTPLATQERTGLIALALAAILALMLGWGARRSAGDAQPLPRTAAWAAGLSPLALAGLSQVPVGGSFYTLLRGLGMVALQVGLAFAIAGSGGGGAAARLRLAAPRPRIAWLLAAVASGLLLPVLAHFALRLVPATGKAPIETFVEWPSGMLAFGTLGIVLAIAEELFFRGLLYGAALRLGKAAAFAVTLTLFVAMHAQQAWGNWGSLLSITVAGTVLTALRAASGSTLVPALAHVLYNFTLALRSF